MNPPSNHQTWGDLSEPGVIFVNLLEMNFQYKNTYRSKAKGWKKIYHVNSNQKKTRMFIIISDKVDIGAKNITKDEENHLILKKRFIKRT